MKLKLITLLMPTIVLLSVSAIAHEGHDVPGIIPSQHGGLVKATPSLYVELTQSKAEFLLYPMSHEFKAIPTKDIKLNAEVQLPRSKKLIQVPLVVKTESKDNSIRWVGTLDSKNTHRYTLKLFIQYQGKKESLEFQVEPQHLN